MKTIVLVGYRPELKPKERQCDLKNSGSFCGFNRKIIRAARWIASQTKLAFIMLAAAVEAVIVHLSCAMKNVVLAGVVLVALLEATSFHVAAVGGCRAWGCPYGQHCVPDDRIGHCVPDDVKSRGPYKPFVRKSAERTFEKNRRL